MDWYIRIFERIERRYILQETKRVCGVKLRRPFHSRDEGAELLCDVAEQMGYSSLATVVFKEYVSPSGEQSVLYDHMRVDITRDMRYGEFDRVMTLRVPNLSIVELTVPWHTKFFGKKRIDEYFSRLDWRMR